MSADIGKERSGREGRGRIRKRSTGMHQVESELLKL